ncbi:hypothetical protein OEZ85_002944 [Tetradesmus obliquus]|uniref:SMODS and SLOG-associating 2TM effector domain-containing protein n=1 Tax=Tetradesmus obliquus TaxID=3088 RepID=A0ABY8U412_TETOB|nr:hypothetical protein OEZ85_002944 [Tetradesmus obliquus]
MKEVMGKLRMFEPEWRQKKQEELAGMMAEQAYESAYEDLGAAMLAAGFKGSIALGIASLLSIDILANFRWNPADLQTGVLWALPAAAVAGLLTILPLPGGAKLPAAAAAAADSSSGSSSSSSRKRADDDIMGYTEGINQPAFDQVRRMARSSAVSQSSPITVQVPLKRLAEGSITPSGAAAAIPPMTQPSWGAALRGLRAAREALLQPWSTDVTPPKARVLRVVEAQLGRLTSEVVWRGLVTTCLAGAIASSWATAGTSQDSPFFYARLFGLLTPQCSLAAAVGLLLLGRIPLLYLSGRPISLYTRLSSLDVQIVGQLTEDDWLQLMVRLNSSTSSRYFIVHRSEDDDNDDDDDDDESGSDSGSDSDSDSEDSYELNSRSAAKRRAAVARLTGSSSSSSSSSGGASKKSGAQVLAEQLRNRPPKSLEDLGQEQRAALMQMLEEKLSQGSKHAQVMAEAWSAAGSVPTAEDRLVRALLLGYTLLTELAPAGAFVATGGNVAASFVASSCYNVLALSMNDVAAQQARSAVRKALGKEWLMQLLPLQGK